MYQTRHHQSQTTVDNCFATTSYEHQSCISNYVILDLILISLSLTEPCFQTGISSFDKKLILTTERTQQEVKLVHRSLIQLMASMKLYSLELTLLVYVKQCLADIHRLSHFDMFQIPYYNYVVNG